MRIKPAQRTYWIFPIIRRGYKNERLTAIDQKPFKLVTIKTQVTWCPRMFIVWVQRIMRAICSLIWATLRAGPHARTEGFIEGEVPRNVYELSYLTRRKQHNLATWTWCLRAWNAASVCLTSSNPSEQKSCVYHVSFHSPPAKHTAHHLTDNPLNT